MRFAALLLVLAPSVASAAEATKNPPPNIVVIFTDDQGYGDIGCFGAEGYETPNLDQLAADGMKLTNFYVSQAVCSASRASLLTGCYNVRVGITGALGPESPIGLNPDETTIADLAKDAGYTTACYGKWHLGHHPEFLPTNQGFDEYVGVPYSHDMWPLHPENDKRIKSKGFGWPPLPMYKSTGPSQLTILNDDLDAADATQLTTRYTEEAVSFLKRTGDEPFLLYLAHSLPHVPLFVSDKFEGTQPRGLYGDVIREIDWSVGQIVKTLDELGVSDNTFVIFCSDNGPWLSYGDHAGSAGPFREGKGTTFEGGVRTPTIAKFPGKIPASVTSDIPAMTIDVLPTIAGLIGAKLPKRPIDGRDLWAVLTNHPQAAPPHDALFFYWGNRLEGVREGKWKLHFPHTYRHVEVPGTDGRPGQQSYPKIELSLFDLEADPGERTNVAAEHPNVVSRLKQLADEMREDLGDRSRDLVGSGRRQPGRISE